MKMKPIFIKRKIHTLLVVTLLFKRDLVVRLKSYFNHRVCRSFPLYPFVQQWWTVTPLLKINSSVYH